MQSNQSIFQNTQNRVASLWRLGEPKISEIIEEFSPSVNNGILFVQDSNGLLLERMNYKFQNEFLCSQNSYIQLTNLYMKVIKNKQMRGILIATNKEFIQLYASKDKLFEQLYDYIKKYAIQQDFHINYNILKLRGKGTFAKVYKVINVYSKQKFAVKAFKKQQQKIDVDLSVLYGYKQNEIVKEIEILRNLNHQYIIKLYEVYEDDTYVYLVMDYLQGSDLLTAMENEQNSKYDEQVVQNIIWKLLTAASYIHKKNIMHRDFKLENIILKYKNDIDDIVVVDFGLSDFYSVNANYIHTRCGTIGYVAPEILQDQPYDCKVDIFSLGVIMFTLLAQQSPFNQEGTDQILSANENCLINFTLLEEKQISPNGIDLIKKMLKQDPYQRITADEALQNKWFQQEPELGSSILIKLSHMTLKNNEIFKQKNFKQNSPLWNFQSQESIGDSEGSPQRKEITNKYFNQFVDDDQFQIEDDVIEHEGSPAVRVQKYKLLARQKSL